MPSDVMAFTPDALPRITPDALAAALRTSKRGSAPGLSGMRAEHLQLLLQDAEGLELLAYAGTCLARAEVPSEVVAALALARLTALSKPNGGVRSIATGDTFRRLVSRVLARQWANVFDAATQPFQYALQARAGTDALAALLRTELELRPDTTIVSLDGRSAYDCISRRAFLTKLREVAPALVPFVRLFYGQPSTYCWWDDAGRLREVRQGEGCEQGDPLAPALFALGQHDALVGAAATLQPHEELAAFLDDVYVVTTAPGARRALDTVTGAIAAHCGIDANLGKTRVFNFTGEPAPGNIAALGDGVWCSDKATHERGLVVLGTPIHRPLRLFFFFFFHTPFSACSVHF